MDDWRYAALDYARKAFNFSNALIDELRRINNHHELDAEIRNLGNGTNGSTVQFTNGSDIDLDEYEKIVIDAIQSVQNQLHTYNDSGCEL